MLKPVLTRNILIEGESIHVISRATRKMLNHSDNDSIVVELCCSRLKSIIYLIGKKDKIYWRIFLTNENVSRTFCISDSSSTYKMWFALLFRLLFFFHFYEIFYEDFIKQEVTINLVKKTTDKPSLYTASSKKIDFDICILKNTKRSHLHC